MWRRRSGNTATSWIGIGGYEGEAGATTRWILAQTVELAPTKPVQLDSAPVVVGVMAAGPTAAIPASAQPLAGVTVSARPAVSACPTDTSALAKKLPHFSSYLLEIVRQASTTQEIMPAITQWKAQGKPLSALVDQTWRMRGN